MENYFGLIESTGPEDINLSPELKSAIKNHESDYRFVSCQYISSVGVQLILRFDNNIGASLIILDQPEPGYSELELAVIRFEPPEKNDWLMYPENGLTDKSGLARNLTPIEVGELLGKIKGL